jgi:hypothetical protein
MNLEQARRMLDAYLDADIPAFAWGAPGVGKSDLMRDIAKARAWPLIDFRALLRDPIDLRGLPSIDHAARKAVWLSPAELPDATRDGPEGLLFMDELNAASPAMQAACFGLVLDRKVGEYALPPGWRIVAAGNRQSDKAAAQRMPTALANRFAHIDIDADPKAWTRWAAGANIAPEVIAFIGFRPALLHKMPEADARAFPTPRAWAKVAKVSGAPDDIRSALVAGLVGDAAAGEFEGFLKIWRTLPPLPAIIADPQGAPVPTDPGVVYAVASALARYATRQNFDSVLQYGERLPADFRVVLAMESTRRDPDLQTTAAYVKFAAKNQGLFA